MPEIIKNKPWNEIIEHIIVKSERQDDKQFIEWLKTKEHLGYHSDASLYSHAFEIYKKINKGDNDHFTIISGKTGSGKSVLGLIYCSLISPSFSMEHICFSVEDFFKIIKKAERGDSILLDEGAMFLFSREAMNKTNKGIIKLFDLIRQKGFHFVACIPNFYHIDGDVRKSRADTLLYIRKDKDTYRGITKPCIDIINSVPSIQNVMAVKIPYGKFWDGYWTLSYPPINDINEESYRTKKKEHLDRFINDISNELIAQEQPITSMIKICDFIKLVPLSRDIIVGNIKKGSIPGCKIGGNWFIKGDYYRKILTLNGVEARISYTKGETDVGTSIP